MSFNVSQLIHMNDSCAIFRQSTFSRGVLMFCSWFMMLNDWHCLWTTLGWTHPRINIQQGGLVVVTDVILTSHSQDLNTLLTTWGPPNSWTIKLKLSSALYIYVSDESKQKNIDNFNQLTCQFWEWSIPLWGGSGGGEFNIPVNVRKSEMGTERYLKHTSCFWCRCQNFCLILLQVLNIEGKIVLLLHLLPHHLFGYGDPT